MGFIDNPDTQFAIKKLLRTLAKPIAIILAFAGLVLFLMRVVSEISAK